MSAVRRDLIRIHRYWLKFLKALFKDKTYTLEEYKREVKWYKYVHKNNKKLIMEPHK